MIILRNSTLEAELLQFKSPLDKYAVHLTHSGLSNLQTVSYFQNRFLGGGGGGGGGMSKGSLTCKYN